MNFLFFLLIRFTRILTAVERCSQRSVGLIGAKEYEFDNV